MMKINKLIAFGLLLAPAAMRADSRDIARGVVFHASRLVAGALATHGLKKVEFIAQSNDKLAKLSSLFATNGYSKLKSDFLPGFALFATAGLAPQALNSLTDNFLPGALSWLTPSEKGQKEKAGRVAFWAGMAAEPLVDIVLAWGKRIGR